MNPGPRAQLHRFLAALRNQAVRERRDTVIDFSQTHRMMADGTLLFFAELHRIVRLVTGRVRLRARLPENRRVRQVLAQIGVLRLLRCRRRIQPTRPDVVNWRAARGRGVEGRHYDTILGSYDGVLARPLTRGLYNGLVEAMTNCHHHAYIAPRQDGLNQSSEPKDWWMFSQERDGWLTVVFCDLGVGIPETIPATHPDILTRLKRMFASPPDGDVIKEAIQESRARRHTTSRTGKAYRGHGLRQLVDALDNAPDGSLALFSNRGCYTYRRGRETASTFTDSILGTLITWRLPVGRPGGADDRESDQHR